MNFTIEHRAYSKPSKEEILFHLEDIGYEGYIPFDFIDELFNLICFYIIEGEVTECLRLNRGNPFEDKLHDLYINLPIDDYLAFGLSTPMELVGYFLKDFFDKVDYRKIELQEVDFNSVIDNSEFIPTSELEVKYASISDGSYDLSLIVEYYNILNSSKLVFKLRNLQSEIKIRPIDRISDIMKIKKHNLHNPLLLKKLINKDFSKRERNIERDVNLVIMEDATNSMTKGKGKSVAKALQLILVDLKVPVTYIRYHNDKIDVAILTDKEDKKAFFNQEQPNYSTDNFYDAIFEKVNEHKMNNLVILTDGYDNIKSDNIGSFSINCIDCSEGGNKNLVQLSELNNGKYIRV